MRKLVMLMVVLAAAIASADTVLDQLISKYGLSRTDAARVKGMAKDYGRDPFDLVRTRDRLGMSTDDLARVTFFSRGKDRTMQEAWRLRKSGLGWGQVAHKMGIQPGVFNKQRVEWEKANDRQIDDVIWNDRLHRSGLSDADIAWARSRGHDWRDINAAQENAKLTHRPFRTVTTEYGKTKDWNKVKWSPGNAPPAKGKGKGDAKGGKGKGNSKGKGKGGGKG